MYRTNFPDAPGMHNQNHWHYHWRRPLSLWEQFRSSWLTAVIGIVMFIIGALVLFWNEGRAVQTARSLDEGLEIVQPLQTVDVIFDENDRKLVHLIGSLWIQDPLEEKAYGISIAAVKLKCRVQVYQWVEQESTRQLESGQEGDHTHSETSYYYTKEWKDKLIDSVLFNIPFGHENPLELPKKSKTYVNNRVKVGNFLLGSALKDKFADFIPFTSDERPDRPDVKMHAGLYYHSKDVWNPEIGDFRIQFSYAGRDGDVVSIIAKQAGRELRPYQTSGDEILILHSGRKSAEDIFSEEHAQNRFFTWIMRVVGWFIMFLGLSCVTNMLNTLVSRFPVICDLVALGVTSLNMSISISFSLLIIAFGWLWYRPLFGIILVLGATLPFLYSGVKLYRRDSYENRYRRQL